MLARHLQRVACPWMIASEGGEVIQHATSSARRNALVLAGLLLAAFASTAVAERAAVLVTGKATDHERTLVVGAVSEHVGRAAWTLDTETFNEGERNSILLCLKNDRPWPCIGPMVGAHKIDRLFVVRLDLGRRTTRTPAITAQLVLADNDRIPPFEARYCDPCTPADLTELTNDAVASLIKRVRADAGIGRPDGPDPATTKHALTVKTTPEGASISIDKRPAGRANEPISLAAGHHIIDVELSGHRPERREVDVSTQDLTITVELVPQVEGRSKALPIGLMAGGAALAVGCIVYGLTLESSPDTFEHHRLLVSWPAIGLGSLGVVAAGAGLYLFLRHDDKPRSTPTAAVVPGGAVLGWARSF